MSEDMMSDQMNVKKRSGVSQFFNVDKIRKVVEAACEDLSVQSHVLESHLRLRFVEGMETKTIQRSLIDAAVKLTTAQAPAWRIVAARLAIMDLKKDLETGRGYGPMEDYSGHVRHMLKDNLYDTRIGNTWPLEWFDEIKNEEAERHFDYAGANMLMQRYLVRKNGVIVESIGEMFLTVAILLMSQHHRAWGAGAKNADKTFVVSEVRKAFDVLIERKISLATPLLRNLRRVGGSLTSCFVLQMDDSRDSIFYLIDQISRISKNGGGVGLNVSAVRAKGSAVLGQPGVSGGVLPWVRIANDTFVAVNQAGARAGAGTISLDIWHKDIPDFLEMQTENGDQRRKAFDIYPQLVIPDLFMERVKANGKWTFFCPYEVKTILGEKYDLVDCWGSEFEERYAHAEKCASLGLIPHKTMDARDLIKHIIDILIETGMPYLMFKDTINRANPNKADGIIPSANLCVTGDTLIMTETGNVPAKVLWESGLNPKVLVDARFSGTGNDDLVTPDVAMTITAKDADVYSVKMSDGSEIKCTEWHKFPVVNKDGSFELVHLSKMTVGSKIYLNGNSKQVFGTNSDVAAAYIAGEVICVDKKTIPAWLYNSDAATIRSFLKGLFDTDGFCYQIKNADSNPTIAVQISAVNLPLLQHVKILASMLGLRSRIQTCREADDHMLPDTNREDHLYPCQQMYRLDFKGDNAWQFMEQVGTNLPSKMKAYTQCKSLREGHYLSLKSEKWETKIASIDYLGKEDVYDVTVSPSHTVVFNGIATGQCVESFSNVKRTQIGQQEIVDGKISQVSVAGLVHCCNLLSKNLAVITEDELEYIAEMAVILLDASIDITETPIPEAKMHNEWYRTIGVGVMGWADWLAKRKIAYSSEKALAEADQVFEQIAYYTHRASHKLAKTHGSFGAFHLSEQKKGIFFGRKASDIAATGKMGNAWNELAADIARDGLRHSQILAIAPTTSTSLIQGCTASFLPPYGKFFFDKNGGQTVPICPPYLAESNWYYQEFKNVDQKAIVDMTSTIQKWIDTGISMELLFDLNKPGMSKKHIYDVLLHAWEKDVKCVYYVRSVQKALEREEACVSCSG